MRCDRRRYIRGDRGAPGPGPQPSVRWVRWLPARRCLEGAFAGSDCGFPRVPCPGPPLRCTETLKMRIVKRGGRKSGGDFYFDLFFFCCYYYYYIPAPPRKEKAKGGLTAACLPPADNAGGCGDAPAAPAPSSSPGRDAGGFGQPEPRIPAEPPLATATAAPSNARQVPEGFSPRGKKKLK